MGVDYQQFYHFLEGLTIYDEWDKHIDHRSKHRRLKHRPSKWINKKFNGKIEIIPKNKGKNVILRKK